MPYEVSVTRSFSAAHQLRLYDGSLEPLHGHNFHVEAIFESDKLDSIGVVLDFCAVEKALEDILGEFNNSNLGDNKYFGSANPSAEVIAEHIHSELNTRLEDVMSANNAILASVTVSEAEGCKAKYVAS